MLTAQHYYPKNHTFIHFYHAVREHLRIMSFRRIASFPMIVPLSQVVQQKQSIVRRIFGSRY